MRWYGAEVRKVGRGRWTSRLSRQERHGIRNIEGEKIGSEEGRKEEEMLMTQQATARILDDLGDTVDPFLGKCPVARVNAIADGGEGGGVVAGPELRAKNDMLELRSVGYLLAKVSIAGGETAREGKGQLTPPSFSRSRSFVSKPARRALWRNRWRAITLFSKPPASQTVVRHK